ncbi:MAG: cysteine desulfurase [Bdellovibrionaceae bacterium]|nr:cysteine desulfurase [Pseudobdellovibrionaceae bacterium]
MDKNFVKNLRNRFPQISFMDQKGESYLDSASTSLKMDIVIETLKQIYETSVSNVHRGEHHLSLKVTAQYEQARSDVANFIGAEADEIIFTRNTTEGLNFLSESLKSFLKEGDEILITEMEHHSNFLPWKHLASELNLKLQIAPITSEAELDIPAFEKLLSSKTKIVSLTHISNVTGVINPLDKIIPLVRKTSSFIVIDAAQSISCISLDVNKMDCDFLVFSGHKIFSPSGIGVLYGKKSLLEKMPPYQTGGGTIFKVTKTHTEWANSPAKFEAGTPFIEGALALAKVLSFLKAEVNFKEVLNWERNLVRLSEDSLKGIEGICFMGSTNNRSNILSFIIEGIHSSDLAFILAKQKIALRAGHHCCMPLLQKLNLKTGVVRASFSVYNREEDIKALKTGLVKALDILKA